MNIIVIVVGFLAQLELLLIMLITLLEITGGEWLYDTVNYGVGVPASDCTLGANINCTDAICSSNCDPDYPEVYGHHHRNIYYNLDWLSTAYPCTTYDLVLGVSLTHLCAKFDDVHIGVPGLSNTARHAFVKYFNYDIDADTTLATYNTRVIQHELSHNYGCSHHGGTPCIMNGGFDNVVYNTTSDIWCASCELGFDVNLH